MTKFISKRTYQSGRSMIEMLGVLAIVGVLSAGGIAGYSMAMQSYKANLLIERINLIATRVRTLYKNSNYTGLNKTNIINSGKLSAKDLENPFGGSLNVRLSSYSVEFFVIDTEVANIPSEVCTDIVMTDWGGKRMLYGIAVTGDTTTEFMSQNGTYPADISAAITACKGGNKQMKVDFH